MKLTGAEILVKELIRLGTTTVFGYPGGYVINIYDELYKQKEFISHILPAHEQGGAHAADAYARVCGKTGVVIATGGPGATNLITGIANAYLDSVPVVFITGNVAVPMLGQDSFQDIDIVGVTLPIVKHSYVVRKINDLQFIINEAFSLAEKGRKGPVHIDIPKNIQIEAAEYNPSFKLPSDKKGVIHPSYDKDSADINDAVSLIQNSKRPYIYCGGGVSATDTGKLVMELSGKIGAPIGMSLMGIGSVPASFALNLGMSGMHGRLASITAKSEADLIIALGVRFSDRATGKAGDYAKNTEVIHIDIDAAELGKNIRPTVGICADLNDVLPILVDKVKTKTNTEWVEHVRKLKEKDRIIPSGEFTPSNIINCVNSYYGDDTVVATDVGQHQMWVAEYYGFEKPRKLISSGGLGAMGYGMGAAVGACIAGNRKRTVLITGDGSFGMNLAELATAVTMELPITIILLNNGSLGMVRQLQTLFFDKRYSNTTINRKTDFPALAKAFGAEGLIAENITELSEALEKASGNLPFLIECKIDIDEKVLPMIPAGGTINDVILE
ncbi:MAG: biosynthetic-type acetolactate synthase large subunit [Oscillospiraceae bacterium]|nr:biosynthetic-type acetolactate synthase large subunit [Oscillospiraceae bacterium]